MTEKLSDPIPEKKIAKTDAEWKQQLTPEQFQVAPEFNSPLSGLRLGPATFFLLKLSTATLSITAVRPRAVQPFLVSMGSIPIKEW